MTSQKTAVIVGVSANPKKFGNKSLRAHAHAGYKVYGIHPTATELEGHPVYPSLANLPEKVDRISLYLPPHRLMGLLEDIAAVGAAEVWFNPGTVTHEILEKAKLLGLNAIAGCSIIDLGLTPTQFP